MPANFGTYFIYEQYALDVNSKTMLDHILVNNKHLKGEIKLVWKSCISRVLACNLDEFLEMFYSAITLKSSLRR